MKHPANICVAMVVVVNDDGDYTLEDFSSAVTFSHSRMIDTCPLMFCVTLVIVHNIEESCANSQTTVSRIMRWIFGIDRAEAYLKAIKINPEWLAEMKMCVAFRLRSENKSKYSVFAFALYLRFDLCNQ